MLKSIQKNNVSFAPIKLSANLKDQMLAWYHLGAPPKTYNKIRDECLQSKHHVESIKNLKNMTARLTNHNTHKAKATCKCDACIENHLAGCKNPDKCARTAKRILDNLHLLFNPNTSPKKDNLTLTHQRMEKNKRMRLQQNGEILFDPTITAKDHISECFHIIVNPECLVQIPAYRLWAPGASRGAETEPITIYTDGSCKNNGKLNAACGSGIWINEGNPMNKAIRVLGNKQSNQIGELAAVLVALQSTNPLTPIRIITDSKYVINGITNHLKEWEDTRWIDVDNADTFKAITYQL
ncbi:ribonuclease H-like protein [Suillus hirtellus]|nr:ribonuclease H-like protein [Suillus hirtellus]